MLANLVRAGAVLAAIASPAAASSITYSLSGTVIAGRDGAGVFGGGDLTNDAFTAVETFDPAGAMWSYSNPDGSGGTGGSSTNGRSFAEVVLTIGGASTRFSDYTSTLSSIGGSQFNAFVQSSSGIDKNDIGFYVASGSIKADYTQPNSIQGLTDAYAGYYTLNDSAGRQVDFANFEVTSVVALTAVSLPSSAPMFAAALLGLAAAACHGRRKKAMVPSPSRPRR